MNNNYIPEVFKVKISNLLKYVYGSFFLFLSLFIGLSLLTFNINDNSFITATNEQTLNVFGTLGAYISSFILYTFGFTGYGIVIFFFSLAISAFVNKILNYFFIRLFALFISLVLIPQSFIYWGIFKNSYETLPTWGTFSNKLVLVLSNAYLIHLTSLIGLFIFLWSINFIIFFKLPKIKSNKYIFSEKPSSSRKIKKEPLISNRTSKLLNEKTINLENSDIPVKNQYNSPSLDILENENLSKKNRRTDSSIKENSDLLEKVFADFNIEIKVMNVKLGPVITLYEILPAAGIKINTIINLAGDISRSMGVGAVRIAQIYGTQYLGVEVPNDFRETVSIKELLSDDNFKNNSHKIPICIGKDISGKIEVIDLSKTPHLLVAGTTGSGKSVFINTLLTSLLYKFSPEDLRLILIDPKMLELSVYNDIAHLLTPVVTEPKKAIIALKWVCKEMERRYSLMNEENTRSLEGFNQKSNGKLPYIIVFIDEMADLMMTAGKEVEHYVQRLAQMARACGIHLVMATQRPSVDIITGSIKANFPSRISFQVASKYDSRTVLGEIGAEQLLGNGDMLMSKNGGNLIRYQSAFISDNEVNKLIKEIKQSQKVDYLDELEEIIKNENENFDSLSDEDEELISKSIDLIKSTNKASTSFLQRNFQIGYNKAARIMEALEQRGVVSEPNHTGKRDILINN